MNDKFLTLTQKMGAIFKNIPEENNHNVTVDISPQNAKGFIFPFESSDFPYGFGYCV